MRSGRRSLRRQFSILSLLSSLWWPLHPYFSDWKTSENLTKKLVLQKRNSFFYICNTLLINIFFTFIQTLLSSAEEEGHTHKVQILTEKACRHGAYYEQWNTPISIKVASDKNNAWSMFHSPRCVIVATLVNYVPATSLET